MLRTGDCDCDTVVSGEHSGVGQVTSSWMIWSFKGKMGEIIFNEESLDCVAMFIKYLSQPQTGSEGRGEETSNYEVPLSLGESERE